MFLLRIHLNYQCTRFDFRQSSLRQIHTYWDTEFSEGLKILFAKVIDQFTSKFHEVVESTQRQSLFNVVQQISSAKLNNVLVLETIPQAQGISRRQKHCVCSLISSILL